MIKSPLVGSAEATLQTRRRIERHQSVSDDALGQQHTRVRRAVDAVLLEQGVETLHHVLLDRVRHAPRNVLNLLKCSIQQ